MKSRKRNRSTLRVHATAIPVIDLIDSLMQVVGHDAHQAEQCCYIISSKGSYVVKEDTRKNLVVMRNDLRGLGIKSEIE